MNDISYMNRYDVKGIMKLSNSNKCGGIQTLIEFGQTIQPFLEINEK